MASVDPIRLTLPLDRGALAALEAGDACLLTGPLYTLRDAGHVRLMAELEAAGGQLPYGLDGQAIFYAGPTPAAAGRPFGRRALLGRPAHVGQGPCALLVLHALARARRDLLQDAHRLLSRANSSSFARAAPESMSSSARRTPPAIVSAAPPM